MEFYKINILIYFTKINKLRWAEHIMWMNKNSMLEEYLILNRVKNGGMLDQDWDGFVDFVRL